MVSPFTPLIRSKDPEVKSSHFTSSPSANPVESAFEIYPEFPQQQPCPHLHHILQVQQWHPILYTENRPLTDVNHCISPPCSLNTRQWLIILSWHFNLLLWPAHLSELISYTSQIHFSHTDFLNILEQAKPIPTQDLYTSPTSSNVFLSLHSNSGSNVIFSELTSLPG